MVATRSATSSPVKRTASGLVKSTDTSKEPQSKPLRLLVAPKSITSAARIIQLSNPLDGAQKKFLCCPRSGLYELSRITHRPNEPRSLLFCAQDLDTHIPSEEPETISNGYISSSAQCLTATPFDLAFLILPIVSTSSKSNLFQSSDDLLEDITEESPSFRFLRKHCQPQIEAAMEKVCDTVEAGDERMYRYSQSKTLAVVLNKARRVVERGLPKSMEAHFVTRVLDTPIVAVRRTDTQELVEEVKGFTADSQTSMTGSSVPCFSFTETDTSTPASSIQPVTDQEPQLSSSIPSEVLHLQRLLTAFKYISHSYLPPSLATSLLTALQDPSISKIDFTPLNNHLSHIQRLKQEALSSQSLSNISQKRTLEVDDQAYERAEKKRKAEEDEKKRKANMSHGVKALAKVNTKGMSKLSSFFTKAPAVKPKVKT